MTPATFHGATVIDHLRALGIDTDHPGKITRIAFDWAPVNASHPVVTIDRANPDTLGAGIFTTHRLTYADAAPPIDDTTDEDDDEPREGVANTEDVARVEHVAGATLDFLADPDREVDTLATIADLLTMLDRAPAARIAAYVTSRWG